MLCSSHKCCHDAWWVVMYQVRERGLVRGEVNRVCLPGRQDLLWLSLPFVFLSAPHFPCLSSSPVCRCTVCVCMTGIPLLTPHLSTINSALTVELFWPSARLCWAFSRQLTVLFPVVLTNQASLVPQDSHARLMHQFKLLLTHIPAKVHQQPSAHHHLWQPACLPACLCPLKPFNPLLQFTL